MEAENISNSSLKSEDDIDWDFSVAFENRMNMLLAKDNRIKIQTRRKISRALLTAIIAIIVMLTGMMSVSATRKPFIEFVEKIKPKYVDVSLSEDSTPPVDKIQTEYTLASLPDGYELETYQKDDYSVLVVWKNNNGEEIVFSQNILDASYTIDNEHEYEKLNINGYNAYYTNSLLIWTDGEYWFNLGITNGEKSDIMELAKNICEKN